MSDMSTNGDLLGELEEEEIVVKSGDDPAPYPRWQFTPPKPMPDVMQGSAIIHSRLEDGTPVITGYKRIRPFGEGGRAAFEKAEIKGEVEKDQRLYHTVDQEELGLAILEARRSGRAASGSTAADLVFAERGLKH